MSLTSPNHNTEVPRGRILFVASRKADYLQDLTYAGLATLLGEAAIDVFPPHWPYFKERRVPWGRKVLYPKSMGYRGAAGRPAIRNQAAARTRLRKNSYALVVLAACKPDALRTFAELADEINCPWIFIDGGDRAEIGGDFERIGGGEILSLFNDLRSRKPPALIFKRELEAPREADGIYPLPFSIHSGLVPFLPWTNEKKYRVSFWAEAGSPIRRKVYSYIKDKYDCTANGSAAGQVARQYSLAGDHYYHALNRSELSLSFRGGGWDTMRYWEIPAAGTLMISDKPSIVIPNNFTDRKHVVFCNNDASDLLHSIDYFLAHPEEARQIAEAGQRHLFAHHTHINRAEYLLETLTTQLGLRFRRDQTL